MKRPRGTREEIVLRVTAPNLVHLEIQVCVVGGGWKRVMGGRGNSTM